ncbi:MAG TPA: hypothetical protein VGX26_09640 [Solirubrobacteraceae bacterium]|nr:hypothetical protein [Solirubrobacteraceae bacterium]
MNGSAYKLLGYAVWHGGKWYVQRRYLSRLPSSRQAALTGLAVLAAGAGAVTLARRALR